MKKKKWKKSEEFQGKGEKIGIEYMKVVVDGWVLTFEVKEVVCQDTE